jgi:hypothetical protein
MPVLAERTKIKSEWNISATNEEGGFRGNMRGSGKNAEINIDDNAYDLVSASTRIFIQPYLPTPSPKAKEFLKKLKAYKNLPDNWDGDEGVPPEENNIRKAASFILETDELDLPFYFIAPGPNGEIVIEYKNGTRTAEIFLNENEKDEMILYKDKEQVFADSIDIGVLIKHLH